MSGLDIDQVYMANPITTNLSTDLMYFGRSPYNSSSLNKAMLFSDFAAQFPIPSQIQDQAFTYAIDTGVLDACVISLNPAPASYVDGMYICFLPANNNTGTINPTVDVNGLGPINLLLYNSGASGSGFITPPANTLNTVVPISAIYSANVSTFIIQSNYNPAVSNAFLYANPNNNVAIGGPGTLPSNGRDSVFFGENITAPDLWFSLGVGNNLTLGSNQSILAVGTNLNANASGPHDIVVVGSNNDFTNATQSLIVGVNHIVNDQYCLAIGSSITINSGGGTNFAIGQTITMPGYHNFAFGNNVTINNAGSAVLGDSVSSPVQDTGVNQWVQTYAGGYFWHLNNNPTLAVSIDATGQLGIWQPGTGLTIKSGADCKIGTATLTAGLVVVTNASVTASSLIFLTVQTASGTQGALSISNITPGTNFTINSSNAADASTVAYLIVEAG